MAGYSGTPLAKKLGIKDGFKVLLIQAPVEYQAPLAPVPQSVEFTDAALDQFGARLCDETYCADPMAPGS
jgi:hypothetical protein